MKKIIAALLWVTAIPLCAQGIFVSEFHYDNFQADTNEFVEITTWAQNDLSCYQLLYINGAVTPPVVYKTVKLKDSVAVLQQNGYGTLLIANNKKDQIQNGPKDGFLLYDSCHNTAVQYISYEGTLPAIQPFTELASKDIGVSQTSEADSISILASKVAEVQILTWAKGKSSPGVLNSSIEWGTTAQGTLKGNIYLATENCQSSVSAQASVTLYDMLGRSQFSVLTKSDGSFVIHHIPIGLYVLKINAPEGFGGEEKETTARILVSGEEASFNYCLKQVVTEVQDIHEEITVALHGSNVEIQSLTPIKQIELYSLTGQREIFHRTRFESQLRGALVLCIVSQEGVHRRKIVLD